MRLLIAGIGYKNMCMGWVLHNIMPKKQRVNTGSMSAVTQ